MSFPLRNFTKMKPGNPKLDCLAEEVGRELDAWLAYNPSRRPACYVEVTHAGRGRYRGRGVYTSDQGHSAPVVIYSSPA